MEICILLRGLSRFKLSNKRLFLSFFRGAVGCHGQPTSFFITNIFTITQLLSASDCSGNPAARLGGSRGWRSVGAESAAPLRPARPGQEGGAAGINTGR